KSSKCVYSKGVKSPTNKVVGIMKDYDMTKRYHPGKADVVSDTLSRMNMGSVSHVHETNKYQVKDVHRLARLGVRLEDSPNGGFMVHHNSVSSLVVEVKSKQHLNLLLMELKKSLLRKLNELFSQRGDGMIRYKNRLCVPDVDDLRSREEEKAHNS
uniref:hypothetical protein n=1 Tax=Acinetobacter baumannii TaxID=470 RepID=UPI00339B90E4